MQRSGVVTEKISTNRNEQKIVKRRQGGGSEASRESEATANKIIAKSSGYRSREDALILIDWDDTLFPTHYVGWIEQQAGGKDANFTGLKPNSLRYQLLNDVKNAACALLRRCALLGTVAVVTNSQQGWVADSARRWAPSMMPLLRQMSVVSARSMFEGREAEAFSGFARSMPRALLEKRTGGTTAKKDASSKTKIIVPKKEGPNTSAPQNLLGAAKLAAGRTGRRGGNSVSEAAQVNWKLLAFLLLVFRKQSSRLAAARDRAMQTGIFIAPPPLVVVSIGDSTVEREAVRRLGTLGLPNLAPTRSIKLCTDPSPRDLTAQLIQITSALPNIIFRPTAIDIWLCPKPS